MKRFIYQSSLQSTILCGSETWGLRKNEIEILRCTERAMIQTMYVVKLLKKYYKNMLSLKKSIVAKAK